MGSGEIVGNQSVHWRFIFHDNGGNPSNVTHAPGNNPGPNQVTTTGQKAKGDDPILPNEIGVRTGHPGQYLVTCRYKTMAQALAAGAWVAQNVKPGNGGYFLSFTVARPLSGRIRTSIRRGDHSRILIAVCSSVSKETPPRGARLRHSRKSPIDFRRRWIAVIGRFASRHVTMSSSRGERSGMSVLSGTGSFSRMFVTVLIRGGSPERKPPRGHFVHHHAKRKQIAPRIAGPCMMRSGAM